MLYKRTKDRSMIQLHIARLTSHYKQMFFGPLAANGMLIHSGNAALHSCTPGDASEAQPRRDTTALSIKGRTSHTDPEPLAYFCLLPSLLAHAGYQGDCSKAAVHPHPPPSPPDTPWWGHTWGMWACIFGAAAAAAAVLGVGAVVGVRKANAVGGEAVRRYIKKLRERHGGPGGRGPPAGSLEYEVSRSLGVLRYRRCICFNEPASIAGSLGVQHKSLQKVSSGIGVLFFWSRAPHESRAAQ
jgi:hypothetical protein